MAELLASSHVVYQSHCISNSLLRFAANYSQRIKALRYLSLCLPTCVCGNISKSLHNHEHVRGGINKAFLSCLLFYGIQLNAYVKKLFSDFVIVLRRGWGDGH